MSIETLDKKQWPILDEECQQAVKRVIQRGVLSGTFAPEVQALEQELADSLQAKYVVTTASGTAALMVALLATGLEPGDEVIVPAYTFGATALAVVLCGLTPKFIDVDFRTGNLDVSQLELVCGNKTKAIIPVHIHGLPCDLEEICLFASKKGLVVIEDCAQAQGAEYRDRSVGRWGNIGCFSMQSSKHLGIGEGGFLIAEDRKLAERTRSICSFGFDFSHQGKNLEFSRNGYSVYREHICVGGMFRLQELPAAIARVQLRSLTPRIQQLQSMAQELMSRISSLPGILLTPELKDRTHVWHKIRIGIDTKTLAPDLPSYQVRDLLRYSLKKYGLETTLWQSPVLPLQSAFRKYQGNFDWTNSAGQRMLESSFVLFSEMYPLIAQNFSFVDKAATAFISGWENFLKQL